MLLESKTLRFFQIWYKSELFGTVNSQRNSKWNSLPKNTWNTTENNKKQIRSKQCTILRTLFYFCQKFQAITFSLSLTSKICLCIMHNVHNKMSKRKLKSRMLRALKNPLHFNVKRNILILWFVKKWILIGFIFPP